MIARFVRSTCPRSSAIGEVASLLDMYYIALHREWPLLDMGLLELSTSLPCRPSNNTSQNFTCTYKYSSISTIWLVPYYCRLYTALVENFSGNISSMIIAVERDDSYMIYTGRKILLSTYIFCDTTAIVFSSTPFHQ